jgi:Copper binding periplasmic protein CusF
MIREEIEESSAQDSEIAHTSDTDAATAGAYNPAPMKRAIPLLIMFLLVAAACGESDSKPKPLSVKGEQLHTLKGKILSRSASDNTLKLDHEAIPGFMESMTMDYSVRGASVDKLPPDGSSITAKLHVLPDAYWLTDVTKAAK